MVPDEVEAAVAMVVVVVEDMAVVAVVAMAATQMQVALLPLLIQALLRAGPTCRLMETWMMMSNFCTIT